MKAKLLIVCAVTMATGLGMAQTAAGQAQPAPAAAAAPAEATPVDPSTLAGRPNINQTPVGTTGKWSLEKLLALTQAEGIAIWRTLPAVGMQEMNGHYMGMGPDAMNVEYQRGYANYMFNEKSPRGYWLGKAFRPKTATTGEGYNRWRFPNQRIVRNLRIDTRMGASLIDGKPAYILDYTQQNRGMTLIDEVRKLEDGVYFGAATTDAGGGKRSKPDFFILVGPTDEWVGPQAPAPAASPAK